MKKGLVLLVIFVFLMTPEVAFSQGPREPDWFPDLCLPQEQFRLFQKQASDWCRIWRPGRTREVCLEDWAGKFLVFDFNAQKKAKECSNKPPWLGPPTVVPTATPKVAMPTTVPPTETATPTVTVTATPTPTQVLVPPPLPPVNQPVEQPASQSIDPPTKPPFSAPPFWESAGFEVWLKVAIGVLFLGLTFLSIGWEGLQKLSRGEGPRTGADQMSRTEKVPLSKKIKPKASRHQGDYLERMGLR